MLRIKILAATAVLTALMFVAGCEVTPSSDRDRKAAEAAAARARAEQSQAGDAAKKALDDRVKELQHRIDALKKDAKPVSAKASRGLDEQITKLEGEVAELRSKLSTEQGRAEEWNKLKETTEQAAKKIERKLDELAPSKK